MSADLTEDYRGFLADGTVPSNRLHALVVEELLSKGTTLQELRDFQDRRSQQLERTLIIRKGAVWHE